MSGFRASDVTDQTGRTALVTGANTGIGFETAMVLAAKGARVLLGCRSKDKAQAAMKRIWAEVPGADLTFVELDQNDLASVKAAAEVVADEPRLDLLVNNAGIMMPPLQYTADGFESQFGVNHLATFALTAHLLPKLAEQDGSRVVVTSSIAHKGGTIHFDDLAAEQGYGAQDRYQQSKLANLLFVLELDRRLRDAGSPVAAVGCHPGIAATELSRHMPKLFQFAMPLVKIAFNSPAEGAWPTLLAATGGSVSGGDYVGPTKRGETAGPAGDAQVARRARDEDTAERLWDVSMEMTGVDLAT